MTPLTESFPLWPWNYRPGFYEPTEAERMTPDDYILMCDQTLAYFKKKRLPKTNRMWVQVLLIRSHYVKLKNRAEIGS